MAKLKSSFKNMLLVLMGITLFSALTLGIVFTLTATPIEASKKAKKENAIKTVLPPFERIADVEEFSIDGYGLMKIYKAYDSENQFVGAAIESFTKNGFSGEIKIMVGFDIEGNIVDYSILEQKETPGLGTKMVDWFKATKSTKTSLLEKVFGFKVKSVERSSSIIGKNPLTSNLTVSKDGGDIDAITAATISSRAFLEAITVAYQAYATNTDVPSGSAGASKMNNKNDSIKLKTIN